MNSFKPAVLVLLALVVIVVGGFYFSPVITSGDDEIPYYRNLPPLELTTSEGDEGGQSVSRKCREGNGIVIT